MSREYFRILVPFGTIEDIKLLREAGADELYCGYVTKELKKRWPLAFNILNRRGEGQSFENQEIFKSAVKQADRYNLPVYVTVNGLYTPEQYPLLLELVRELEDMRGVKGIIVADLAFLLTLRKNRFKKEIHISAGGTTFNSQGADFYHSLGANRVILPRHLTSYEIENIIEETKSKIDIEIFVLREGCIMIDGFCTFFHCFEKQINDKEAVESGVFLHPTYNTEQTPRGCDFYFMKKLSKGDFKTFNALSYKEEKRDFKEAKCNLRFRHGKYWVVGCRICDLYQLRRYPVRSLKIVGRGIDSKYNAELIKHISRLLSYLAEEGISKRDYQRKCKDLFSKVISENRFRCTKFICYFNEHWVKDAK